MRRRDIITLIGCVAAWPLAARAQQSERTRHVGALMPFDQGDHEGQARAMAFQQRLEALGWTVSRNIQIDYKWGIDDLEKTQTATAELLATSPDVILAMTSGTLAALRQATHTVPIVFALIYEPVAQGFIQSLAHPGGNMTGFTNLEVTTGAKWLELLKEIAPQVARVAFMFNPENPGPMQFRPSVESAAQKLAVAATMAPVHGPQEIEAVMTMLGAEPGGGLIVPPDGFLLNYRALIMKLAARFGLPAIYGQSNYVVDGGLASFGLDTIDVYRKAADYVDRVLRGESPSDLPAQQPSKFDLAVNLKTARALGLTVPASLLATADEVIE